MTETLDLSGLKCPEPANRTRTAFKKLEKGTKIKVITTDKTTCSTIPIVVKEQECKIIKFDKDESSEIPKYIFLIEK